MSCGGRGRRRKTETERTPHSRKMLPLCVATRPRCNPGQPRSVEAIATRVMHQMDTVNRGGRWTGSTQGLPRRHQSAGEFTNLHATDILADKREANELDSSRLLVAVNHSEEAVQPENPK